LPSPRRFLERAGGRFLKLRRLRPIAAGLLTAAIALAQPVELENFSATGATGAVRSGSTWVGNVQRLADTIVVGGTAKDDNGWGGFSAGLDLSAMRYVTITGQRNPGNEAPFFVLELRDAGLNPHVVSVASAQFSSTASTAVEIPLGAWAAGFNPAQVREWTIGGGTVGLLPFRMALDQIAFAASGSALPPVITAQPADLLVGRPSPSRRPAPLHTAGFSAGTPFQARPPRPCSFRRSRPRQPASTTWRPSTATDLPPAGGRC